MRKIAVWLSAAVVLAMAGLGTVVVAVPEGDPHQGGCGVALDRSATEIW